MNTLKAGDFVRLTKEAVDNFYGTDNNTEMFMIGGVDFDSETFCEYIGSIISFEDGKNAGLVTGLRGSDDSWYITYFDLLNNKWRGHYFNDKDLEKVN